MNKDIKDTRLDYGAALTSLMNDSINSYHYRGVSAVKRFDGYCWGNNWYSSKRLFEEAVDLAHNGLTNSIKHLK
jgi:hypothetical protein